ncbi:MAG: hypothetical protein LBU04_06575 [Christensenellaceae bacterium]|jgi:hypothetical protein|nr:hypothetical protein [Christensenellaceae bacterium]
MEIFECKNCGSRELIKKNGTFECVYCHSKYISKNEFNNSSSRETTISQFVEPKINLNQTGVEKKTDPAMKETVSYNETDPNYLSLILGCILAFIALSSFFKNANQAYDNENNFNIAAGNIFFFIIVTLIFFTRQGKFSKIISYIYLFIVLFCIITTTTRSGRFTIDIYIFMAIVCAILSIKIRRSSTR